MKYILIPTEDARVVFTEEEIQHARKSIDGTQMIVHENILLDKRQSLGLTTLMNKETEKIEWTYPVYEYGSKELEQILQSEEWTEEIENFKL